MRLVPTGLGTGAPACRLPAQGSPAAWTGCPWASSQVGRGREDASRRCFPVSHSPWDANDPLVEADTMY